MTEPVETDAALAGADVELTAKDRSDVHDPAVLDEQSLAVVRASLPSWDVQPFQLSRTVDVVAGTGALRTSLEQVGRSLGRRPEILVTGQHLVVRVRSDGVAGVTAEDVDLAAALDAVFSGSHATGTDPGGR